MRRRMQGHQYRSERCQAHDCEEGRVDNRLGVMLLGALTVTDLTPLGGKNGNAGQKPFQKSKDRRQQQETKHEMPDRTNLSFLSRQCTLSQHSWYETTAVSAL